MSTPKVASGVEGGAMPPDQPVEVRAEGRPQLRSSLITGSGAFEAEFGLQPKPKLDPELLAAEKSHDGGPQSGDHAKKKGFGV